MKRSLILILAASVIVAAVWPAAGQQENGKPAVWGNRCLVFPGTSLREPNLSNIVKQLREYRYPGDLRVRVWNSGTATQTIGRMKISESELSQTDQYAISIKLTGLTGRIGECVKVKAAGRRPAANLAPATTPGVDNLKNLIDDISKNLK
jgi:hypothetical protein